MPFHKTSQSYTVKYSLGSIKLLLHTFQESTEESKHLIKERQHLIRTIPSNTMIC